MKQGHRRSSAQLPQGGNLGVLAVDHNPSSPPWRRTLASSCLNTFRLILLAKRDRMVENPGYAPGTVECKSTVFLNKLIPHIKTGWGAVNRTLIRGFKVRRLAIRRHPIAPLLSICLSHFYKVPRQAADFHPGDREKSQVNVVGSPAKVLRSRARAKSECIPWCVKSPTPKIYIKTMERS